VSDRLPNALRIFDESMVASRPAPRAHVSESHTPRRFITAPADITEFVIESPHEGATVTQKPILNEADHAAIAAKVLEGMKRAPVKPLHEMSDSERDAYANEVWARAGIIGGRPG
jgi:hypothetical protein